MGGLAEWVDGWSRRFVYYGMGGWVGWQKLITFLAKSLDIRGKCINDGLEFASSFCISYEAKYFKMNEGDSSENSLRFISGFSKFTL
jgi:hypothetical protein